MKPPGKKRPCRGFTLIELTAAIVVIGLAMTMLVALMVAARRTARRQSERRLAAALAQGELERLRGVPPVKLPGTQQTEQPLPPEAKPLRNVQVLASTAMWNGEKGLRHIKIVVTWDTFGGLRRELVHEGMVSDARVR